MSNDTENDLELECNSHLFCPKAAKEYYSALPAFERLLDDYNHGITGNRTLEDSSIDEDIIRKALQSQAEKDRVMKIMAEALYPFASVGNYWVSSENRNNKDIFISDNKENPLGRFQYRKRANYDAEQALSEYTKLGGTQDE